MAPLIIFAILLSIVAVASIFWFIPMSLIIKAMASSLQASLTVGRNKCLPVKAPTLVGF